MSTLPTGSAGSDQSIGDQFIASSVDTINRFPDCFAVDSGTPPWREAEAESTGERRPSIPRREDAKKRAQLNQNWRKQNVTEEGDTKKGNLYVYGSQDRNYADNPRFLDLGSNPCLF
ncbi:unnamed protein product [Caretta caretta]